MWDVPVITNQTILVNRPDRDTYDKKEKICPLIDIAMPDDSNVNMKKNWKTKRIQKPGDRGQQDVESEDKNCASYYWSIMNNRVGIR